jgi:chitinase
VTGAVSLSDTWADVEKMFPSEKAENGTNMYGCLKQINLLKQKNRNLKVLLSIGGWTISPNFAAPMATDAGWKTFAKSSVQLLKDHGFDGLDVDWEYPTSKSESQNWVDLMRETRLELEAYEEDLEERFAVAKRLPFQIQKKRPHCYLTIAAAAGPLKFTLIDPAAIEPYLDFVNLIAYDYSGSWDNTTRHNENLYSSKKNNISTRFVRRLRLIFI